MHRVRERMLPCMCRSFILGVFFSCRGRTRQQVLRHGNRTQSGGDAYDAVTRLVGCPSLVLIVADSELALPVKITVAVCAASVTHTLVFLLEGLHPVCLIETGVCAPTHYRAHRIHIHVICTLELRCRLGTMVDCTAVALRFLPRRCTACVTPTRWYVIASVFPPSFPSSACAARMQVSSHC